MFGRTKETTSTGTRHGHESLGTQGWDGGTVGDGQADWTGGVRRGHGVGGTATDEEAERFKTENGKEATHLSIVQWRPCRPQSLPCSRHGGQ